MSAAGRLAAKAALLGAVLAAVAAPTRAAPQDTVLFNVESAAGTLTDRFAGRPQAERDLVGHVQNALGAIDDAFAGKKMAQPYVNSLAVDDAVLRRAAGEDFAPALADVAIVSRDLDAKLYALHGGLAFSDGDWDGLLDVSIKTLRGGQIVGGYLIRMNMEGMRDAAVPFAIFNDPTSPTTGRIPPGVYYVLVERIDGQPLQKTLVHISGDRHSVQPVVVQLLR